jgi:hypothetical protein
MMFKIVPFLAFSAAEMYMLQLPVATCKKQLSSATVILSRQARGASDRVKKQS